MYIHCMFCNHLISYRNLKKIDYTIQSNGTLLFIMNFTDTVVHVYNNAYCIAENFHGPKYSRIGNYETFHGKIFVVPTNSISIGHVQFYRFIRLYGKIFVDLR